MSTAVKGISSIIKPMIMMIIGALLLIGWPVTAQDGDSRRTSVSATITANTQDHVEWLTTQGVLIEYIATQEAHDTTDQNTSDKKTKAQVATDQTTPTVPEKKTTKLPTP